MKEGWIRLYRKVWDNPIWTSERFSRGQAMVDLLLMANHETKTINIKGIPIKVKRGEIAIPMTKLSTRWGWNWRTVQSFISDMVVYEFLQSRKNNLTTIISINNYLKYQGYTEHTAEQNTEQKPRIVVNNKDKEVNNNTIYDSVFFELWNKYPKHRKYNFKKSKEVFVATVKSELDVENIRKALDNYMASRVGEDDKYTFGAYTWFNDWKSWIDYQVKSTKKDKYGNTIA